MKYRKKPVVVEAYQWFGHDPSGPEDTVVRYFNRPDVGGSNICPQCGEQMYLHGWVDTLEDGHRVCRCDWIICGVKGEFYPCKPDIFEATYEPAEEDTL